MKKRRLVGIVLAVLMAATLFPSVSMAEGQVEDVIFPISAAAGSSYEDPNVSPDNLVSRDGLSPAQPTDLANTAFTYNNSVCWHTDANPDADAWVLLDLGKAEQVGRMYVWNLNQDIGNYTRDSKEIEVTYSADSTDGANGTWQQLGGTHTLKQSGKATTTPALALDFGAEARYVKIQILSSYGAEYWGLGKILFTRDNAGDEARTAYLELQAAYNQCEGLAESDYTAGTWSALTVAKYQAKELLDANSTDVTALRDAKSALEQAKSGLVSVGGPKVANVSASEYYHEGAYNLVPENAVDGDPETWWATNNNCAEATFTLNFEAEAEVNRIVLREYGSYNNIKSVGVEYESGGEWKAASNVKAPVYSGQARTIDFDRASATAVRLTLQSNNVREGLNIAEIELLNEEPLSMTVTATNSDAQTPAGYLADGDRATVWKSAAGADRSVVEIDYGRALVLNTLTIHESEQTAGKLSTVSIEYYDGAQWSPLVENADCAKLPYSKNFFFKTVVSQKLRLTLNNGEAGAMAIEEIEARESAASEMPVDTGLIELEPNVVPNARQQTMVDRGYTMFIHFGLNTFGESEWTYGDVDPSVYAPTQIDAEQWVRVAYEAGMKTVLLVSKHHDGFALWDSAYTDYDVGNPASGSHTDVIQAISDACNKYGMNLGLYYSAWDNNWDKRNGKQNDAEYNEYMRNQLTELMSGKYGLKDANGKGVISELWIDGNWEKAAERWEFDKMYDTVKKLQPSCQVGLNWTIGNQTAISSQKEGDPIHYFPSDFRLGDGQETRDGADADPKLFTYRGQTYYLPFEATLVLNSSWFYHTGYGTGPSMSPDTIAAKYNKYKSQDNILVLNCGPNRDGQIEQADIDSLYAAAKKLGIARGDAAKRTAADIEAEAFGQDLALGSTGTSNETYTKEPGYEVEKMFDGESTTRWASDAGHDSYTAEITLPRETTFNTLTLNEDPKYIRANSVTIEYFTGSGWEAFVTNEPLASGQLVKVLDSPVTTTQLRLSIEDAEKSGPTFTGLSLYLVAEDKLPGLEVSVDKAQLFAGDTAVVTVCDDKEGVNFLPRTTFMFSNPGIVSVDAKGNLTAEKSGTTELTATAVLAGRALSKSVTLTVGEGKGALQSLYDANKDKAQENYTDESWAVFRKALGDVKAVLEDTNATQEQIDGAQAALEAALAGLAKKGTTIVDQINEAPAGGTVVVPVDANGRIPAEALNAAKGKDVNLVTNYGSYSWTVNGKDVTGTIDETGYDLTVKALNDAKLSELAGGKEILQIEIAHNGELPFKATLRLYVGTEHNGKTAHLYYYNEGKTALEYHGSSKVDDGYVTFEFTHCSKYAITLEKLETAADGGNNGSAAPKTGDETNAMLWFLIAVIAGAVGGACASRLRKRKQA